MMSQGVQTSNEPKDENVQRPVSDAQTDGAGELC